MLACLHVPLFPLAARLRSEPDLKGEAVAVFEGNGNAARVVAAARRAREKGIQPGMTLPQARSICPGLTVRARDLESERAAQEALLEVADTFSPRVEDAAEGLVYMDLEGLPSLLHATEPSSCHPGERSDEGSTPVVPQLTIRNSQFTTAHLPPSFPQSQFTTHNSQLFSPLSRDIILAAEKSTLPLRVGVAASKLAARVAAGLPDSPTIVPEGEEREFLARLPLSRLAPQIDIAETLERWGIRSIGDFARLPEGEVASRLGDLGRELHAAARGIDPRPLEPRMPPPCLSEGMDLEWPLATLEPFLFLGNAALERLVARLESQGLACVKLEVTLKLDPDGCDARAIALPAPTREVRTLLTLVRLELEARPPGAPVSGFAFAAHPDKPRRAQLSLFGPAALSPDRLATTIARLAALLGAGRVGSPRAVNGHLPERYAQVSYAPPPPPTLARPPRTGRGLLAVRVLRPPIPLEVLVAPPPLPAGEGRGEGGPCHPEPFDFAQDRLREGSAPVVPSFTTHNSQLTTSLRLLSLKSLPPPCHPERREGSALVASPIPNPQSQITNPPSISGSIKVASGPWSLEEGWWLADSRSGAPADPEQAAATFRDYWDVELSDGALYRIYRDRAANSWFADGIYD